MRNNGKLSVAAAATASLTNGKNGSQSKFDARFFLAPPGGEIEHIDASGDKVIACGKLPRPTSTSPLAEGLTLMAVIANNGTLERLAAVSGLGRWHGAAAFSTSRSGGEMIAYGHSAENLAVAVNAVIKAGGGLAITSGVWINALVKRQDLDRSEHGNTSSVTGVMQMAQRALDDVVDHQPSLLLERLMTEPFKQPHRHTGMPGRKPCWQQNDMLGVAPRAV